MSPRDKGPRSLGDGLRSLVARIDKNNGVLTARILEAWDQLMGPEIAAHTRVERVDKREITVAVDSAVWANELQAISGELLGRLESVLGKGTVQEMRFIVSRSVSGERRERESLEETTRGYGGPRVAPVPLTQDERDTIARSVAAIPEGGLREAVLRATVSDLEWKKGLEAADGAQEAIGGRTDTE